MTMMKNTTQFSYFILGGYFQTGNFKYLYFLIILLLYVLIICANSFLICLICMNRSLHKPMYMFLCSLCTNELFGSTGLFPVLLVQTLSEVHTVPTSLCFLQIICLYTYATVEFFTLAVMSYDRYLAICHPLQYNSCMTFSRIALFIALAWIYPLFINIFHVTYLTAPLQLCGNIIYKTYCDNYYIVKLACSDTTLNNVFGLARLFTMIIGLVLLILYTYVRILKVCFSGSKQTRRKAVTTCTPHLVSLLNFSCGAFFEMMHSRFDPVSSTPSMWRSILSLYWLTGQPLINPIVYGLIMSNVRNIYKIIFYGRNNLMTDVS